MEGDYNIDRFRVIHADVGYKLDTLFEDFLRYYRTGDQGVGDMRGSLQRIEGIRRLLNQAFDIFNEEVSK